MDEDRGSCDDMVMTEYGGGASLDCESRGGSGGGLLLTRWVEPVGSGDNVIATKVGRY